VCGISYFLSYLTINSGKKTMAQAYSEALEAPTREEFFARIKGSDLKNYVLHYKQLEYFMDK
jgi:hypothetical protein